MRKDLLAVVVLCLALTSGVASKSKSSLSKDEISQAVTSLLTDVRKAKSVSDYIGNLQNYEAFKRDHKSSGICFPAAPYLENPSSQPDPNQAHKRCTGGYKLGERLGKKWAKIAVRDGKSLAEGMDNLRCLLSEVNPASPDILPICTFKGAKLGYSRWHQRYTSPRSMDEYTSLTVEQGDSGAEDGIRAVPDGTERSMTPEEMEYVKGVGLSEESKSKIDHQ
jgi:hypothetical protein